MNFSLFFTFFVLLKSLLFHPKQWFHKTHHIYYAKLFFEFRGQLLIILVYVVVISFIQILVGILYWVDYMLYKTIV